MAECWYPENERINASRADNERVVIKALTAYRLFTTSIHAVYVDERCVLDQLIHGPAETLAGHLNHGEVVMHPDTAARYARHFLVIPYLKEVPTVAADIEHKTFVVKREEWFVPTGGYTDQYGACWTDLMLAITHATQRLGELGEFNGEGEPASDQIKIVPHDEHVVVRIEYTQEQK
jgi:hypothetical protein